MFAALTATDKSRDRVRGAHFGQPLSPGEPTGYVAASAIIGPWISERFETVQATYPPQEHEQFLAHFRGLTGLWASDEGARLAAGSTG